jgi:hypothetical protein
MLACVPRVGLESHRVKRDMADDIWQVVCGIIIVIKMKRDGILDQI